MLILAAGIPRSGSTWLYNAARLLLQSAHSRVHAAWIDDVLELQPLSLVKIHEPLNDWASKADTILTSHRDLRDIAVSVKRMGWAPTPKDQIAWAKRAREQHDFWAPRSAINAAYDDILNDPRTVISMLAGVLNVPAGPHVEPELSAIPSHVGQAYDSVTLLHPGHRHSGVSGGWRQELEPDIAARITEDNNDWLTRYGYE